jgi:hypothetical protein
MVQNNSNLHKAKSERNSEYYTRREYIEDEVTRYKDQFKNKIVYCNCDDPYESEFFKYFAMRFKLFQLKKLIATNYVNSPIAQKELPLFKQTSGGGGVSTRPYYIEINNLHDFNNDGAFNLNDIKTLLEQKQNTRKLLKDDGDFRSQECINLLKKADIICTNPPFHLFRDYVAQLLKYKKKFLIIGNSNAVTYKEIFPLIKSGELYLGYKSMTKDMLFDVPEDFANELIETKKEGSGYKIVDGKVLARASAVWYTNLQVDKSKNPISPYLTYKEGVEKGLYSKYDNYNAINIDHIKDIPKDYYGVMGVPISFLDKYVPNTNYKIINFRKGNDDKDLTYTRERERVYPYLRILIQDCRCR